MVEIPERELLDATRQPQPEFSPALESRAMAPTLPAVPPPTPDCNPAWLPPVATLFVVPPLLLLATPPVLAPPLALLVPPVLMPPVLLVPPIP